MTPTPETLTNIEKIIAECKCSEEMFFTDSKEAAKKIFAYLVADGIIIPVVAAKAVVSY